MTSFENFGKKRLLNKILYDNNQKNVSRIFLPLIILMSLVLNLWGNKWGEEKNWHPDELVTRTIRMVQSKTLNPGYFAYGASHYYVIGAGAILPAYIINKIIDPAPNKRNKKLYSQWRDRMMVRINVAARTISAIMSCFIILSTFFIGKLLFDYRIGLIASLMLAIMPFFVILSHFATIDPPANFWYWLACLFGLLGWKKDKHVLFALAFFFAGIAIGTKIDRLIVILPLILGLFFADQRPKAVVLLVFVSFMIVGFIAVNPACLLSSFEFLDGVTRETFFNMLRGKGGDQVGISITQRIMEGMGIPIFLMAMGGICMAFVNLYSGKNRLEYIWLLSTIMPYYIVFGSNYVKSWYAPFLFPALAIFSAYFLFQFLNVVPSRLVPLGVIFFCAVLIYTGSQSVSLILQLVNDSRYLASQWIEENIPKNTIIELGPRPLILKENDYQIIKRVRDPAYYKSDMEWRDLMKKNATYQFVRKSIYSVEEYLAKKFNIKKHDPYISWFDQAYLTFEKIKQSENKKKNDIVPAYKVLNGKPEKERIAELNLATSKYVLVKHVKYKSPVMSNMEFSFVNPDVYIYKHKSVAN
jgi:hypothetical protein